MIEKYGKRGKAIPRSCLANKIVGQIKEAMFDVEIEMSMIDEISHKVGNITAPIYKKGSRNECNNFR